MSFLNAPSSAPANITPVMNPQTQCLFFRLPRELRDIIYSHAFEIANEGVHEEPVQLNGAELIAPQPDLALTCRRIFDEAVQVHQAAYTAFWSSKTFVISDNLAFNKARITARHMQQMTHILIGVAWLNNMKPRDSTHYFDLIWNKDSGWQGGSETRPVGRPDLEYWLPRQRVEGRDRKVRSSCHVLEVLRNANESVLGRKYTR